LKAAKLAGAILYVLITVLGPVSGAHINSAVTLVMALRRELPAALAIGYGRPGNYPEHG